MDSSCVYDFENAEQKQQALRILDSMNATSGTQYISFYLRSLTADKLARIKTQIAGSRSIKLKKTQKAVSQGLETLADALIFLRSVYPESTSFAIFTNQKFCLALKLPDTISVNKYVCGKSFDTTFLNSYSEVRWGLCVLDTHQVSIGVLENSDIRVLKNYSVFIPGKMRAGGQSQPRFQQTRKNLVMNHVRQVSETCNAVFPVDSVSKLLLGGVIPTTDVFYNRNQLRPDLKKILASPTSTCYTNPKGLEELVERNRYVYEQQIQSYFAEKDLLEKVLKERKQGLLLTRNQLENIHQGYSVVKVITTMDASTDGYCDTCEKLYTYNMCEHKKVPLDPNIYRKFSSNSRFGKYFKRTYTSLYEINFKK